MELHECQIGMIVINIKESYSADCKSKYQPYTRIGYIKDLCVNAVGEVITRVEWADEGIPIACHQSNVMSYTKHCEAKGA